MMNEDVPISPSAWLIVDKPTGMTSMQAVSSVRRILRQAGFKNVRLGHAGTLDPLASGVLPMALGEARKLLFAVVGHEKEYRVTLKLGQTTDSDDADGHIISQSDMIPSQADIETMIQQWPRGTIQQTPPIYSAIKVNGQRAYALARADAVVTLAQRSVELHSMTLEQIEGAFVTLHLRVGKGFYVRSLVRDMGAQLGCGAHVTILRRLRVGQALEKDALSIDFLRNINYKTEHSEWLRPLLTLLDDILVVAISAVDASNLRHGKTIPWPQLPTLLLSKPPSVLATCDGVPIAVCANVDDRLQPRRVLLM